MKISVITPGKHQFQQFVSVLQSELGQSPDDYNITEDHKKSIVLGGFERGSLRAFAIFRSFLDPTACLGGMIDPEYYNRLKELDDVSIFNISLIRTTGGTENLAEVTREFVSEIEKILLQRTNACCLLISLFRKANKKAFSLYKSLGFKQKGAESYFMDVNPYEVVEKFGIAERKEGNIFLKTFNEMGGNDMISLAKCYKEVFVSTVDVPVMEYLEQIMSKKSFLPELSTMVCDTSRDGAIAGFCFIERESSQSVYISAAGLSPYLRGTDISGKAFSWIMRNCIKEGYSKATLITTSKKLRDFFSSHICARHRDTLLWFMKSSIKDE